jgi:hypothetical protein
MDALLEDVAGRAAVRVDMERSKSVKRLTGNNTLAIEELGIVEYEGERKRAVGFDAVDLEVGKKISRATCPAEPGARDFLLHLDVGEVSAILSAFWL